MGRGSNGRKSNRRHETAQVGNAGNRDRHSASGLPAWRERHPSWAQRPVTKAALLAAVGLLAWQLTDIILLTFAAVLIAVILHGLAKTISARLHFPVSLSLILITIALACAISAICYWIVPTLLEQASDLGSLLMARLHALRRLYGQSPMGQAILSGLSDPSNLRLRAASVTFGVASNIASDGIWLLMTIIASIYLASEADFYVRGAIRLFKPRWRPLAHRVAAELASTLRKWLLGQLVDMVAVGGLVAASLFWLGIPAPFALATLAGLLTIIPYFGALIAGAAAVLVALTVSFTAALWVVGVFAGCHVLEGYVVAPLVQRRMVRMPPAIIIGALAISEALFGPLGIVLGAPLGVVALVLVRQLYIDQMPDEPEPGEAAS